MRTYEVLSINFIQALCATFVCKHKLVVSYFLRKGSRNLNIPILGKTVDFTRKGLFLQLFVSQTQMFTSMIRVYMFASISLRFKSP